MPSHTKSIVYEHEVADRFAYQPPDGRRARMHDAVGRATRDAALTIVQQGTLRDPVSGLALGSRELSLALTKLEEARMWANAHIARNVPDEGKAHG